MTTEKHQVEAAEPTAADEWKKSWTVVLAAFIGVSLGSLTVYSTGLFIQPLEQDMGWSRTAITGGLALMSIVGVLFSPLVGVLIDRWGARPIAIPGATCFCIVFGALSLTGGSIWSWWAVWLLIAFAALMLKPTIWSAAVSSHFSKGRGLAIAITFCGTGLGSSAVPLLANYLIVEFGWRLAYASLGGIFFLASVPLLFLFFKDARKPQRSSSVSSTSASPAVEVSGWSVSRGLKSRQFIQMAIGALLITTVIVGFVVHIVPMLTEFGIARESAVKIVSLIGVTSIAGRLIVGFLFDRLPGPPVGMVSVGLPAVAAALVLFFPDMMVMVVLAVIILGFSVGGEYDAIIYLSTRYFGLKNFATLFGFVTSLILAGVGLGPFFAGGLYDLTGSYKLFLWLVIPMSLTTSVLLGTLGKYPDHSAEAS